MDFPKKVDYRLYIASRRKAIAQLEGAYMSVFRSRGMTFEEVREYVPGDDVRLIDWNVTARTQVPHIKVFRDERHLRLCLAIDCSRSMSTGRVSGDSRVSKFEVAGRLAAVLGAIAAVHGDEMSIVSFDQQAQVAVPARRSLPSFLTGVANLEIANASESSLVAAVAEVSKQLGRSGVAIFVSDFCADRQLSWLPTLTGLLVRHDVILLRVRDPLEGRGLPRGLWLSQSMEQGTFGWSSGGAVPNSIEAALKALQQKGADTATITCGDDECDVIAQLLKRRMGLRGRSYG